MRVLKVTAAKRIIVTAAIAMTVSSCEMIENATESYSVAEFLEVRDDRAICQTAAIGNPPKWNPYADVFVDEAKRRELTCGIKADKNNGTSVKSRYAYLNAAAVCYYATANGKWEKKAEFSDYVAEAKRRGLKCNASGEAEFKTSSDSTHDVAVVIANSNYKKLGKGIPNVKPAYTDAKNIKKYFMESLGVREGNIIYLKDATGTQMTSVFGSDKDHRGKLFNWTKRNVSKVYVYYAGHGAPGTKGTTYLVPSDADSETVQLTGYPLKQLYKNLGKVPATSITVILEACFSGQSQGGYLSSKISGIRVVPIMPSTPKKITVISAGAANQVATWEKNGSQSLFTKYFLKGMSGEGDKKPYGNSDGKVSLRELKKYLDGNMTYYARRYYGRTQQAQIVVNGKELSPTN